MLRAIDDGQTGRISGLLIQYLLTHSAQGVPNDFNLDLAFAQIDHETINKAGNAAVLAPQDIATGITRHTLRRPAPARKRWKPRGELYRFIDALISIRQQAVFPLPWVADNKFWPSVNRIDDVYGDRNQFCACVPMDAYEE